jgi:hypothetical protein
MKLNRICLLLVASLFTLFSSEQLAAQSSASITAASAAPQDTIYAHPGRLVSTGDGARLNFYCMGAGSPAVVFESTFGDWSPAWVTVLPRIAAWTRACVYDHAGAGFSDPGPMPRTNVRLANELHQALHNAGIAGPYTSSWETPPGEIRPAPSCNCIGRKPPASCLSSPM